jgi:hypothetical protein
MISFLFWNIHNNALEKSISNLAKNFSVDMIMLAESSIEPSDMLSMLNSTDQLGFYYTAPLGCKRIEIYSKFQPEFYRPIYETDLLTIRHVKLPGLDDFLLAIVHLPSKMYWDESSQFALCINVSNIIKDTETRVGHRKTILVGDLNMNPFEDGEICASGLHAVMTKKIASNQYRIVQGHKYPFFYNPMWNFFGDIDDKPPGSFYYPQSIEKAFFGIFLTRY